MVPKLSRRDRKRYAEYVRALDPQKGIAGPLDYVLRWGWPDFTEQQDDGERWVWELGPHDVVTLVFDARRKLRAWGVHFPTSAEARD